MEVVVSLSLHIDKDALAFIFKCFTTEDLIQLIKLIKSVRYVMKITNN